MYPHKVNDEIVPDNHAGAGIQTTCLRLGGCYPLLKLGVGGAAGEIKETDNKITPGVRYPAARVLGSILRPAGIGVRRLIRSG